MRILVQLDGVLSRNHQPLTSGIRLLTALKSFHQIVILADESAEAANRWLAENRILPLIDDLVDDSVGLHGEELAHRQIASQRGSGPITAVMTADPSLAAWCFEQGITALLVADPDGVRPEWRPDAPKKRRSWDDIEKAIRERVLAEVDYNHGTNWE